MPLSSTDPISVKVAPAALTESAGSIRRRAGYLRVVISDR
jgi:hypothetical protein